MAFGRRIVFDLFAPALLGAMAALGFAPWNIYPATIAALVGLFALWRAHPGVSAWRGFVFGLAQFGFGLYWLFALVRGAGTLPAVLASGIVVGYLALYPALAGALAGATRRLTPVLWSLVVVPAAWGVTELLRGWVLGGFPWLSLGYVTVAAPLNGLAPVVGVHGLSIALMAAGAALWLLFTGRLVARLLALAIVAAMPVAVWSVPSPVHWTHPRDQSLHVAVLQADAANDLRRRYRAMGAHEAVDLEVRPVIGQRAGGAPSAPGVDGDATLGAWRIAPDAWHRRYRLVGSAIGDAPAQPPARRAVRAADTGPVPGPAWLIAGLARTGLPLAAGPSTSPAPRVVVHGVTAAVAVGFDDLFASMIRPALPAAGLLVDLPDDDRMPRSGRAQQLEIARMRALESGRPLVHAVNRGPSAIVGFDGRLFYRTACDRPARLHARVTPRGGATPFASYGNAPLWWASAAVVLLALLGAVVLGRRDWRRRTYQIAG